MQVLELSAVIRKESYIYYRRNFTATAKLAILSNVFDAPIEFTIETSPLGTKTIELTLDSSIDFNYPLMPITSAIKKFILSMDSEGTLP